MARAKRLFLLGVSALLVACGETSGPPSPQRPVANTASPLHQLRWRSSSQPRTFALMPRGDRFSAAHGAARAPVVLDNNQISFWAYADRDQSIQINYLAADGTWQPYVSFNVPRGALAQFPDGRAFAEGDSVQITLSVAAASLVVRFEPTGLVFSSAAPAHLTVWYADADPDFDASGAVDATDGYIEQDLLGMWVQEFADAPWSPVTAVQSVPNKLFAADVAHFSDFAVSW